MPKRISRADIFKLSAAERIQLVEEIWDSIAIVPESVVMTEAQRRELDRRIEAHRSNPAAGDPWDAVKARILRQN